MKFGRDMSDLNDGFYLEKLEISVNIAATWTSKHTPLSVRKSATSPPLPDKDATPMPYFPPFLAHYIRPLLLLALLCPSLYFSIPAQPRPRPRPLIRKESKEKEQEIAQAL